MSISTKLEQALATRLLSMADDELILAHRNSEWIGHAPILEEDIALANIAQDELGHAHIWYGLHQELTGDEPDELVFFREASAFCNVQLVELPKGDWALTMLRQYLFDAYELALLTRLADSQYQPLADAVAKIKNEEIYHYRHSSTWVKRLGLGTEESQQRMQRALDELWPYAYQLFAPVDGDVQLVKAKFVPALEDVQETWESIVLPHLQDAGLVVPSEIPEVRQKRVQHTTHLAQLLDDLQKVARLDPQASW